MSLSKIKDVLALSNQEIEQEILVGKKQLFCFRLQRATKDATYKKHRVAQLKHRINQLLMVQGQRNTISPSAGKTV